MPCANESILIPMQDAGRWATRTDPIVEEEIWVRATDATRLAEQFIARAVAGDPAMLLGVECRRVRAPRARWFATRTAHHAMRLDVYVLEAILRRRRPTAV